MSTLQLPTSNPVEKALLNHHQGEAEQLKCADKLPDFRNSTQHHQKKQRTCTSRYRKAWHPNEWSQEQEDHISQRQCKVPKNKKIHKGKTRRNIDQENDSTTKQKMLYSYESSGKEKKFMRGRHCFNAECSSRQIYKKLSSRVHPNKFRYLCEGCYHCYDSNNFCQICEQVYFQYENCNLSQWQQCYICNRRVHSQCLTNSRMDEGVYVCKNCESKQIQSKRIKRNQKILFSAILPSQEERFRNYPCSLTQRTIFSQNVSEYPDAEMFLNRYNASLCLSTQEIQKDIAHLKLLKYK